MGQITLGENCFSLAWLKFMAKSFSLQNPLLRTISALCGHILAPISSYLGLDLLCFVQKIFFCYFAFFNQASVRSNAPRFFEILLENLFFSLSLRSKRQCFGLFGDCLAQFCFFYLLDLCEKKVFFTAEHRLLLDYSEPCHFLLRCFRRDSLRRCP